MRRVVEVDRRQRPALLRAQLVEHAVLRHLEEPRRELAAEREPRQALEDAQEDLLRQVLGERLVAVRQAKDVVVDRRLVRAQDDRERTLVTPLGLPEDRQDLAVGATREPEYSPVLGGIHPPYVRIYEVFTRHFQRRLDSQEMQGRRRQIGQLAALPEASPRRRHDQRHGVRRVRRVRADAVGLEHLLGVAVVGRDQADTAELGRRARRRGRGSGRPSRPPRSRPGSSPVWPTMSGFAKLTTQNA